MNLKVGLAEANNKIREITETYNQLHQEKVYMGTELGRLRERESDLLKEGYALENKLNQEKEMVAQLSKEQVEWKELKTRMEEKMRAAIGTIEKRNKEVEGLKTSRTPRTEQERRNDQAKIIELREQLGDAQAHCGRLQQQLAHPMPGTTKPRCLKYDTKVGCDITKCKEYHPVSQCEYYTNMGRCPNGNYCGLTHKVADREAFLADKQIQSKMSEEEVRRAERVRLHNKMSAMRQKRENTSQPLTLGEAVKTLNDENLLQESHNNDVEMSEVAEMPRKDKAAAHTGPPIAKIDLTYSSSSTLTPDDERKREKNRNKKLRRKHADEEKKVKAQMYDDMKRQQMQQQQQQQQHQMLQQYAPAGSATSLWSSEASPATSNWSGMRTSECPTPVYPGTPSSTDSVFTPPQAPANYVTPPQQIQVVNNRSGGSLHEGNTPHPSWAAAVMNLPKQAGGYVTSETAKTFTPINKSPTRQEGELDCQFWLRGKCRAQQAYRCRGARGGYHAADKFGTLSYQGPRAPLQQGLGGGPQPAWIHSSAPGRITNATTGPPSLAGPAFPPLGSYNNQMPGIAPLPTIHEVRAVLEPIEATENNESVKNSENNDIVSAAASNAADAAGTAAAATNAAAAAPAVPAKMNAIEEVRSEKFNVLNPYNVTFNQTCLYSSKVPICDDIRSCVKMNDTVNNLTAFYRQGDKNELENQLNPCNQDQEKPDASQGEADRGRGTVRQGGRAEPGDRGDRARPGHGQEGGGHTSSGERTQSNHQGSEEPLHHHARAAGEPGRPGPAALDQGGHGPGLSQHAAEQGWLRTAGVDGGAGEDIADRGSKDQEQVNPGGPGRPGQLEDGQVGLDLADWTAEEQAQRTIRGDQAGLLDGPEQQAAGDEEDRQAREGRLRDPEAVRQSQWQASGEEDRQGRHPGLRIPGEHGGQAGQPGHPQHQYPAQEIERSRSEPARAGHNIVFQRVKTNNECENYPIPSANALKTVEHVTTVDEADKIEAKNKVNSRERGRRGGKSTRKVDKNEISVDDIVVITGNVRGVKSKITSIKDVLNKKAVKICMMQETNLGPKDKIKLPSHVVYSKGSEKQNSGVITAIHNSIKDITVKVKDSSDKYEEYNVVRLDTTPGLTIINVYAGVEARKTKEQIRRGWQEIMEEAKFWDEAGDCVLIGGDINAKVGSDEFGIDGSKDKISIRGQAVRDTLQQGEFVLLNNSEKASGGPPTRIDPSDNSKKSTLDYFIANKMLERYTKLVRVDDNRDFSFKRVRKTKMGVVETWSDHLCMELVIRGLKVGKTSARQPKETSFNYKKPGGWDSYRHLSNCIAPAIDEATRLFGKKKITVDEANNEITRLIGNIKEQSFGYTTMTKRQLERKGPGRPVAEKEKLFAQRTAHLEKDMDRIELQAGKVVQQKIWSIRKELGGGKQKGGETAAAVEDPITNKLATKPEDIKKAHAEHVKRTLMNNPDTKMNIDLLEKRRAIHKERMKDTGDRLIIQKSEFDKVVGKIKLKNKRFMYDLVRGGDKFRAAIFRYVRMLVRREKFPKAFKKTTCVALYKGRGQQSSMSSYRYIHCKDWLARLVDLIVVNEFREDLLASISPCQTGGIPKRSTAENLFCLKTAIAINQSRKNLSYASFYDLEKFFDREQIEELSEKLHEAGIRGARFRNYHKLQEGTEIVVKTPLGLSESFNVGAVVGQGAAGAALSSAQAMDRDMQTCLHQCEALTTVLPSCDVPNSIDVINNNAKCDTEPLYIRPLIYQDDVTHITDSAENCADLHARISRCFEEKGLRVNSDKCSVLVIGKGKRAKQAREFLTDHPVKTMGAATKLRMVEKYLGDYISCEGLKESVTACLDAREPKARSAVNEIIRIIEDPRASIISPIKMALAIIEYAVKPMYLYACETWVGISKKDEERLDNMQCEALRRVLGANNFTLKAGLLNEAGVTRWSDEVKAAKLWFAYRVARLSDDVEAKKYWKKCFYPTGDGEACPLPGTLAEEVAIITEDWGIPATPHKWMRGDMFYKTLAKAMAYSKTAEWVEEKMSKSKTMKYRVKQNQYNEKHQSYLNGNMQAARLTFAMRAGQLLLADTRKVDEKCDCGLDTFNTKHLTSGECAVFGELVEKPPKENTYMTQEGEYTSALWLGRSVRQVLKAKFEIENVLDDNVDSVCEKVLAKMHMSRQTKEYLTQLLPTLELSNRAKRDPEHCDNFDFDDGDAVDDLCLIDQLQIADLETDSEADADVGQDLLEEDNEAPLGGATTIEDKENTYGGNRAQPSQVDSANVTKDKENTCHEESTEDKENSCRLLNDENKENPRVISGLKVNNVCNVRSAMPHEWGAAVGQEIVWSFQPGADWQVAHQFCNSSLPTTKQDGRDGQAAEGGGVDQAVRRTAGGPDDTQVPQHTVGDRGSQDGERVHQSNDKAGEHPERDTHANKDATGYGNGVSNAEGYGDTAAAGSKIAGGPGGAGGVHKDGGYQSTAHSQHARPKGGDLQPGDVRRGGLQHGDLRHGGEPSQGDPRRDEGRDKNQEKRERHQAERKESEDNGFEEEGWGGGAYGLLQTYPQGRQTSDLEATTLQEKMVDRTPSSSNVRCNSSSDRNLARLTTKYEINKILDNMGNSLVDTPDQRLETIDVVNVDCNTVVNVSRVGGRRNGTEVELQSSLSLTTIKKLDDTHTSSSLSNTYSLFSLDNKSNLI